MISRAEAARRLYVHPNTVSDWVRRGLLHAHAIPGGKRRRYYDPIEVEVLGDRIRRHEGGW